MRFLRHTSGTEAGEAVRGAVRRLALLGALTATALLLVATPAAAASPGAVYDVKAVWGDTNLPPGGEAQFQLRARNDGDAVLPGAGLTLTDRLPKGLVVTKIEWSVFTFGGTLDLSPYCSHAETPPGSETETLSCHILGAAQANLGPDGTYPLLGVIAAPFPGPAGPAGFFGVYTDASGYLPALKVDVEVPPGAEGSAANTASIATPLNVATRTDGGPGANELQALTVKAGAGQLRLIPTTAAGAGTVVGSEYVTSVSAAFGQFRAGDLLSGPGIQSGTTIEAVEEGGKRLKLSKFTLESGSLALTAGEPTADLAFDASPAAVQAALEALPGVGADNVAVSGGPGDEAGSHPYLVEFKGALAARDVPPMSAAAGAAPPTGGTPDFTDADQVTFSPTPSAFGVRPGGFESDPFSAAFPFGSPARQAGAHPFELRTNFELNQELVESGGERLVSSNGFVRTVEFTLPRGFIGNPEALPKCDPVDFANTTSEVFKPPCPADTQVGYINVTLPSELLNPTLRTHVPIFSLVPPKGSLADFALSFPGVQAHIYPVLDPARNYAIKTVSPDISAAFGAKVRDVEVVFWGVPGDPAHDRFRYLAEPPSGSLLREKVGAPFDAPIRPLFTNPMDCGFDNGGARIRVDSYEHPEEFSSLLEYGNPDNVTGCDDERFHFEPDVALQPTDRHAGAPTGLDVLLEVPQRNDEAKEAKELYAEEEDGSLKEGEKASVKAIATPPLKKVVVTLPQGMTVSPSAAPGLESCTPAQIGIDPGTGTPNAAPVRCPDASQYGTLRLKSPALPQNKVITGRVYVAQPYTNPFGSFLALYLAIEDEDLGLQVKLAGEVKLDPATGQITTVFDDLPQLPASEVEMKIKGGLRAGLVNPQTCGEKTIRAEFFTWQDPSTPHPVEDHYDVTQNPDGSPCHNSLSERPFDPTLSGGTLNPMAGAFSPLALRMTRTDEDQELSVVEGTAPPGLTASLRGIPQCSDAQIAAAANPSRTGAEELESPSCPASSQVGTVDAGAGVGQVLTWVKGKIYLAGPYEGAPVSGVAIVPAVAGPFDLGTIVTRAPAYVDPVTAQISLKTDPLPLIFKGVPVRVRDIRVHLDRPGFTLNPTSCEPMSLNGTLFSSEGKSKEASNRFQAADCASLGFKPKLSFKLRGGTKRGGHPALTAVLKARPGDANIAGAQVTLPYSEYLDQGHLNNICTRVQFKANQCPAASIYGHAVAKTPLFDTPLEGPVYLRSNPAHNLPDLVAAIRGPDSLPVEVDLQGRVDSVVQRRPNGEKVGGIRNSFEVVPDAPVTEFTLSMQGGKKGLLENSENLCTGTFRASARFTAQNGRAITLRPALKATSCRGKGRRGGRGGHRAKHRRH